MKRVAVLIAALLLSGVAAGCASAPTRATDTALTAQLGKARAILDRL